jgi:hypothetical protein
MHDAMRARRRLSAHGRISRFAPRGKRSQASSPPVETCGKPRRLAIAVALATLLSTLPMGGAFAQEASRAKADPDWPCRQILVGTISLPTVWSGPSIEGVKWRGDAAIADLVTRLAARRMPLDEAERAIEDFAGSKNADKASQLTALFAGLFETLNAERAQVIDGLRRVGRRQRELAAKIRAKNALIQSGSSAPSPQEGGGPDLKADAETLALDLRIFDERRQSLTYVCETPTLIEQRLFALAKAIQKNLN